MSAMRSRRAAAPGGVWPTPACDAARMSQRILVTYGGYDLEHPDCGAALVRAGLELEVRPRESARTPDELSDLIGDAVAVIADADPFDARVFARAPELRIIARTGVGLDSIDLPAATASGVLVTVTPDVNSETVADHTLALMLAVLRRIPDADRRVRDGGWRDFSRPLGQLHGRNVGLVGFGAIGQAVGRRLQAFGAELLVHDPWVSRDDVTSVALDELLSRSDLVSLHLPLSAETAHVLDAARIASMKPGAILVNTARGGLVDQDALVQALHSGSLAGAGLDVFETEPPGRGELSEMDCVVLSPHHGGISDASNLAMSRLATASVLAALAGNVSGEVANRDVLRSERWIR